MRFGRKKAILIKNIYSDVEALGTLHPTYKIIFLPMSEFS